MKKFNKNLLLTVVSMALGLSAPFSAFAVTATAPVLGTASTFSVLAGSTITADGSGATISGDLGISPGSSLVGTWTHTGGTNYLGGAAAGAMSAATSAFTSMNPTNQPGGTTWNPVTDLTPAPGLYTRSGDATFTGTLLLTGTASDVWIFQITDDLTFAGGATVNLGGSASACNVFWYINRDATINGSLGNKFVGTLIANRDVSLLTGSIVNGRMMALTGTLSSAGGSNITGPTGCAAAPVSSSNQPGTIQVVKTVINDNGGTKTVADFPLFVNGTLVVSGATNSFPAPAAAYTVTETGDLNYTRTFSGDCDVNGQLTLSSGANKVCTITNNDIATTPLINVTKIPTPLALPAGPGLVTYDYTVLNLGLVAMSNVTVTDDKCTPANRISGDVNGNNMLDTTETWRYSCTAMLATTTTNFVIATGQANGFTAADIAEATVVVGSPLVPPLIHIVKIPNIFFLPVTGGAVTYTYFVTNPGTVPLSDVTVTDDKCTGLPGRVIGHPGDLNNNNLLESTESWTFTCQTNLTQTTTNIGTATGQANGFIAVDLSPATVAVASPGLPNTGIGPDEGGISWNISMLAGILAASTLFYFVRRKQTN